MLWWGEKKATFWANSATCDQCLSQVIALGGGWFNTLINFSQYHRYILYQRVSPRRLHQVKCFLIILHFLQFLVFGVIVKQCSMTSNNILKCSCKHQLTPEKPLPNISGKAFLCLAESCQSIFHFMLHFAFQILVAYLISLVFYVYPILIAGGPSINEWPPYQ